MDRDWEWADWQDQQDASRRLRTALLVGVVAFGITLAAIVGNRMDEAATSIITGVTAGIAASVPATLILLALLRGRSDPLSQGSSSYGTQSADAGISPVYSRQNTMAHQPPVLVVTPPGHYLDPYSAQQGTYQRREPAYATYPPQLEAGPVEYQIIGDSEVLWDELQSE